MISIQVIWGKHKKRQGHMLKAQTDKEIIVKILTKKTYEDINRQKKIQPQKEQFCDNCKFKTAAVQESLIKTAELRLKSAASCDASQTMTYLSFITAQKLSNSKSVFIASTSWQLFQWQINLLQFERTKQTEKTFSSKKQQRNLRMNKASPSGLLPAVKPSCQLQTGPAPALPVSK